MSFLASSLLVARASLLGARTLLVAPGLTTRNKKLLGWRPREIVSRATQGSNQEEVILERIIASSVTMWGIARLQSQQLGLFSRKQNHDPSLLLYPCSLIFGLWHSENHVLAALSRY